MVWYILVLTMVALGVLTVYVIKVNKKLGRKEDKDRERENELEDLRIQVAKEKSVKQMNALDLDKYINNRERELEELGEEVKSVERKVEDAYRTLELKRSEISDTESEIDRLYSILGLTTESYNKHKDIQDKIYELEDKKKELKKETGLLESEALIQEYGLYEPQFSFSNAMGYKDELKSVRNFQKNSIKSKESVNYNDGWIVNGSEKEGRKMMENSIKQLMRAFNNECDTIIDKVKTSNIESMKNRIKKSYDQLNKINEVNSLSISEHYLNLKYQELELAYEYELKKEEEKEEMRLQREKEKEEKKLKKELEDKKKKADKEIKHYDNMIEKLQEKLRETEDENARIRAEQEIKNMQEKVNEKEKEKEEIKDKEMNASAGYVYIISNIGSFGKNVVKIGVTRRLEPLERIKELSGASVPFGFDVHALVFSNNAYELENDLHNYFDEYRVNKVNYRKEFFRIPISEIENKLEEYGNLTIDFTKEPKAEEYYGSVSKIK